MVGKRICKNCKHYYRNVYDVSKYGVPEGPYETCSSGKFLYLNSIDKNTPKDVLTYYDAEGYAAFIQTGEDFGCIHFKQKK